MSGLFARLAAMFARPAVAAPALPKPIASRISAPDAATFIAGFEGFRAKPYLPTPRDVPTIGYGTTVYPDGAAVTLADGPCTEAQARLWLAHDIADAEAAVRLYVKVPITEAQRISLVSFTYNCGREALASSTLLRLLNGKRYGEARAEFGKWVKQGEVTLPGLVKRRAAEAALFGGHP